MLTREIPRDEWMSFLESFSQQHRGWLVTVEVISQDIGGQEEARNLPLEGITSSESNENQTISISVGNVPSNHLTHTVSDPTRLLLKQTQQGADKALEIESTEGVKTLLRFRSAMPAEMVDGLI